MIFFFNLVLNGKQMVNELEQLVKQISTYGMLNTLIHHKFYRLARKMALFINCPVADGIHI